MSLGMILDFTSINSNDGANHTFFEAVGFLVELILSKIAICLG
jgi:hypothetical protein